MIDARLAVGYARVLTPASNGMATSPGQGSGPDRSHPRPGSPPRKELVTRLLRRRRELCAEAGKVGVHQVRRLASLGPPGPGQPEWAALMVRKQRNTLVVCHPCRETIHHGQPTATTA
jgi:hypothetical protein